MANKIEELIEQAKSTNDGGASVVCEDRKFGSEAECERFFDVVKARMLDIKQWDRSSTPSAYALFDENGKEVPDGQIEVGRFMRISIHGSGKSDWVRVRNIHEVPSEIVITVQPAYDPTEKPPKKDVISHFFLPIARNNFCLKRTGSSLSFYVIGIDEKTNADLTDGILETARNVAAANLGSYLGIQKGYWKEVCSSMLSDD